MQSRGYGEWQNVMGIRADEPRRVTRLTSPGRDNSGGESNLPLARANVREADVLAFWRAQPFDLALDPEGDFGNCDGRFLKARHKIVRAFVTRPELATWWINEESRPSGATFRNDRPRYSELLRGPSSTRSKSRLHFPSTKRTTPSLTACAATEPQSTPPCPIPIAALMRPTATPRRLRTWLRRRLSTSTPTRRAHMWSSDSAATLGRPARAPVFSEFMGQECAG